MKSRDTLVRLKRFQVEEKRRRLTQIEMMIAEFGRMAGELDREIAVEEQKSGVKDMTHYAYSTYARAARSRARRLYRRIRSRLGEALPAEEGEALRHRVTLQREGGGGGRRGEVTG